MQYVSCIGDVIVYLTFYIPSNFSQTFPLWLDEYVSMLWMHSKWDMISNNWLTYTYHSIFNLRRERFDMITNELRCINCTSQNFIWIKSRWMTLRHTTTSSAKTKWRSSTCTCFISLIFTLKFCSFVKWVANHSLISITPCSLYMSLDLSQYRSFDWIWSCRINIDLLCITGLICHYDLSKPQKEFEFSQVKDKENPRQN